jgi:hypothetical protein
MVFDSKEVQEKMMKRRKLVISILLLIMPAVAISCAYSLEKKSSKFHPAEYKSYDKPGTASISGQAFITKGENEHIYANGCTVVLHPVTNYSAEFFRKVFLKEHHCKVPPYEHQVDSKYTKTSIADRLGKLKFEGLSASDYYLFTVIPQVQKEGGGPLGISHLLRQTKDGRGQLWAIVKLSEGEHEEMFLSKWVPKIP